MSEEGYLYILSNPSMPGIVMIDVTTHNPSERIKDTDLNGNTGVPTPYTVEFHILVNEPYA